MIKHNYSGIGLTDGVRKQVQRLVDALWSARQLHRVRVNLVDRNGDAERAQTVLEPFKALSNLESDGTLVVTGAVTKDFAGTLYKQASPESGCVT